MTVEDFDKIYVLHLAERDDRLRWVNQEFGRMNLLDKIDIWWTCKRPVGVLASKSIPSLHTTGYDHVIDVNPNIYGAVFNCALEHYTMIKTSYYRGLNNIMIFEDDIAFFNDRLFFDLCLSQMPENYAICKLYYTTQGKNFPEKGITPQEIYNPSKHLNLFSRKTKSDGYECYSAAAYCLDREGMWLMINSYESRFSCADVAFYYSDINKIYTPNYRILHIQNEDMDSDLFTGQSYNVFK